MSLPSKNQSHFSQQWGCDGQDDKVMLSFKGAVTEDLITTVLQFVETRFKQFPITARVRRKIISVLVETMQNIFRHSSQPAEHDLDMPASEVCVYRKADEYLVVTGNRVEAERAIDLKKRIDSINAMSKEELNASYRRILETKAKSSKEGSGVGMIDIARRTGQQIDFDMEKMEDGSYFCSMQIKIAR